ncbi:hypothetical protein [Shinella sumterensis]|uniref:hypothetical protein n=1 Tax=Shinella sumterensis TaxID=1967501 RepID=UPI003F84B2CD
MPAILLYGLIFLLAPIDVAAAKESRDGTTFSVQAAFLPQDDDPVINAVTCKIGQTCRILYEKQHDIGLSLEVWQNNDHPCLMQKISLDCGLDDCSFENGRSEMNFGDDRRFTVFEEPESGVETLLVLKARPKIGEVLLVLPALGRNCLGRGAQ